MESVRNWVSAKRAGINDPDHRRAIDALELLLNNETSPTEAAKAIATTYQASLVYKSGPTTNEPEDPNKVFQFWVLLLCDAIRTLAGDDSVLERMVALLVELSMRPDVKCADGSAKKHISQKIYWRDLPCWPAAFAEYGLRTSE